MTNWTRVAERQLGLITPSQMDEAGVSRSQRQTLLRNGTIIPVHRGVYRTDGSPQSLEQRRLAAVLALPAGALSHRAAAGVWGASPFRAAEPEIVVPMRCSVRLPGVTVHRSRHLRPGDVMAHRHYPRITRPFRTVLDLASLAIEDSALEEAGADLLLAFRQDQRRLRSADRHGRAARRIHHLFGDYLADGRRPPHPGLERRLLGVVQASDLPAPVVHLRIDTPDGRLEVDLAWPDVRVAVEADSARWHSSAAHLRLDRTRDQALSMVGWTVVRFTWEQVRDHPDEVVHRIATILAYRAATAG